MSRGVLESPDAPENRPQDVVGHDKDGAHAADAHIGAGVDKGLRRGVHPAGEQIAAGYHHRRYGHGHHGEDGDARSDPPSGPLPPAAADSVAHKDGDPHGQAGNDHGDDVKELAAGGHPRLFAGAGELPHDDQVRRPVHGLQQQGE